jgi:hypothetical protein
MGMQRKIKGSSALLHSIKGHGDRVRNLNRQFECVYNVDRERGTLVVRATTQTCGAGSIGIEWERGTSIIVIENLCSDLVRILADLAYIERKVKSNVSVGTWMGDRARSPIGLSIEAGIPLTDVRIGTYLCAVHPIIM